MVLKNILRNPLVKKSGLYIFFNGLNGGIPFILLPILTKFLSTSEYGTITLFQTTLSFMIPLVGLSMGFNIDRLFFRESKEKLAVVVGNMLVILFLTVSICTTLILIISTFSDFHFVGIPFKWLVVIPLLSGFTAVNEYNLILLRNNDRAGEYGFWQVGLTLINFGLSLLFVISLSMGWEGRAWAIAIAISTVGTFNLYKMIRQRYVVFFISNREIKDILKLGIPMLLQGIGVFIIFQSNSYFINALAGKDLVGIFSVAAAFAAIMGIFQDALAKAINPWFYKNLNASEQNIKIKIVKMNVIINFILIVFAFLVYFISKFLIVYMVDKSYHSAISLVLFLALASSFNGMYKISSVYFIHFSKTKVLSVLTFLVAVVSILANWSFINYFGVKGAAYAMLLCMFLHYVITAWYANKIYNLPLKNVLISFIRGKLKK